MAARLRLLISRTRKTKEKAGEKTGDLSAPYPSGIPVRRMEVVHLRLMKPSIPGRTLQRDGEFLPDFILAGIYSNNDMRGDLSDIAMSSSDYLSLRRDSLEADGGKIGLGSKYIS
jgi:hypothetical protein